MYSRALALAGVPTGRLPIVPASMPMCARALGSEKAPGWRAQPVDRAGIASSRKRTAFGRCIVEESTLFHTAGLRQRHASLIDRHSNDSIDADRIEIRNLIHRRDPASG